MRTSNNLWIKIPQAHIEKFRYGSLGLQFFSATTGLQTYLDAFDKSKLVMTFFH